MDCQCLAEATAAHGVELLVQFGSTVAGVTHARSDVDLAVLLARPPRTYDEEADLQVALQAERGSVSEQRACDDRLRLAGPQCLLCPPAEGEPS